MDWLGSSIVEGSGGSNEKWREMRSYKELLNPWSFVRSVESRDDNARRVMRAVPQNLLAKSAGRAQ